jgi:hypothetical protein
MAKRIYIILGLIALATILYLIISPEGIQLKTLVWIVTIVYAVFVGCVHGIITHSLTAKQKGSLMFYPVLMGALFGLLAYIYIYVVMPIIIPGFM